MNRRMKAMRRRLLELNEQKQVVNVFDGARNDKNYQRHRKDLRDMKKKIDDSCPSMASSKFFSQTKLQSTCRQIELRAKTNLALVNYLNMIHRTKGKVDCYNSIASNRNSKLPARVMEQQYIQKLNKKFAAVLKTTEATKTSSRKDLDEIWKLMNRPAIVTNTKFPIVINSILTSQFDLTLEDLPSYEEFKKSVIFRMTFKVLGQESSLGTVKIMLNSKIPPEVVDHFKRLISNREPTSTFCNVDKIFSGLFCQMTGGINGSRHDSFAPFTSKSYVGAEHRHVGTLSMLVEDVESYRPSFRLSLKKQPLLDCKQVAIGRVIKGLDVLLALDCFGSRFGLPRKTIIIESCGILE